MNTKDMIRNLLWCFYYNRDTDDNENEAIEFCNDLNDKFRKERISHEKPIGFQMATLRKVVR